ncbi:MAG: class I SAM-dependent methyltransferase [Pseudomonadota bacterium]
MPALYDTIGQSYAHHRQPDPRIAETIRQALGPATSVVNVGAGAGSYEPNDRRVIAVEPSAAMIQQRPVGAGLVVQARAEALPFRDRSFDAAMAILTLHHWTDLKSGLLELRRVTRGAVAIVTFDAAFRGNWLTHYFPALTALDERVMPPLSALEAALGALQVSALPVPHDCADGFLYAYWRRPEAYLDPAVRAGMSAFWAIGDLSEGLARLGADLESGAWQARHADLLAREESDLGYRLIIAR